MQSFISTQLRYSSKKSSKAAKARKAALNSSKPKPPPPVSKKAPKPITQSVKGQPAKSEPVKAQLAKSEPVKAQPKTQPTPPTKVQDVKVKKTARSLETYWSVDQALYNAGGRTLLYKKNSLLFNIGCYALAGSFVWFGAKNYQTVTMELHDVPKWVVAVNYFALVTYGSLVVLLLVHPTRYVHPTEPVATVMPSDFILESSARYMRSPSGPHPKPGQQSS